MQLQAEAHLTAAQVEFFVNEKFRAQAQLGGRPALNDAVLDRAAGTERISELLEGRAREVALVVLAKEKEQYPGTASPEPTKRDILYAPTIKLMLLPHHLPLWILVRFLRLYEEHGDNAGSFLLTEEFLVAEKWLIGSRDGVLGPACDSVRDMLKRAFSNQHPNETLCHEETMGHINSLVKCYASNMYRCLSASEQACASGESYLAYYEAELQDPISRGVTFVDALMDDHLAHRFARTKAQDERSQRLPDRHIPQRFTPRMERARAEARKSADRRRKEGKAKRGYSSSSDDEKSGGDDADGKDGKKRKKPYKRRYKKK